MDPNLYLDTVSKKLKRVTQEAKDAKKAIIYNLCSQLKEKKKNNDGTIPYGYISKAVEHLNEKSPELKVTRHNLSYHIRKMGETDNSAGTETASSLSSASPKKQPGEGAGRPKGSTIQNKSNIQISIMAAKNEIATIYASEKKKIKKGKRMKRGRLDEITKDVIARRGLPNDFQMNMGTLKKRLKRGNLLVTNPKGKGSVSPLVGLEEKFLQIILRMSRIGASLKPSECVGLINDCIEGTEWQTKLIEWKQKHSKGLVED